MATKENQNFDVVVIGAGPGGYVCAIKAAQLGLKAAVVEKESLGGVCLNVGCIPSKALIHAGNFYENLSTHAQELGIRAKVQGIDLKKLKSWKDGVVQKLTNGIGTLLKANNVEVIQGEAHFENPTTLFVKRSNGSSIKLSAKNFVIATGSRSTTIAGFEPDGKNIITSTEALDLNFPPKRLIVIGGGYIGLELGTYLCKVGSHVTILEAMDKLLATMDQSLVQVVVKGLKRRGIEVITNAKAKSWKKTKQGLEISFETPEGKKTQTCDVILLTIGRKPNSDHLSLKNASIQTDEKGFIKIDRQCRTNIPHIFAIGDVAGGMLLAHKASREGIVCAETMAGRKSSFDTTIIPAVVFTDPEIATVGLTTAAAQKHGFDVTESQFPFAALGKALASGQSEGFAKVVAEKKSGKILGVHFVGTDASSILGEACLALEMGAVLEDIALTIHAHPTLPEIFMEASEAALGHPIHMVPKLQPRAHV